MTVTAMTGPRLTLGVLGLIAMTILAACGGRQAAPPDGQVLRAYPVFADREPHPGIGNRPARYGVHGIDVARYQTAIDWPVARAAGVSFAYIKATEGGDRLDPMFTDHWDGAGRAGVRRGAYHFYYFCRPAAEQAAWFIRNVPRDANALPPVLDMEWNPFSPTCTTRPPGSVVRAEARIFLDMIEAHYGKRPVIYTTVDFFQQTGIGQVRGADFWLRSVAAPPEVTYPGADWTFWQYSGTGIVPGIPGPVDLNVFAGSVAQWRGWGR